MATFNVKIKNESGILVVEDASKNSVALRDFLIAEILKLNSENRLDYNALFRELDASYINVYLEGFAYEESDNPCLIIENTTMFLWTNNKIAGKYSFSELQKKQDAKMNASLETLKTHANESMASVIADTKSFLLRSLEGVLSELSMGAKDLISENKLDVKKIEMLKTHLISSLTHLDQIIDQRALKSIVDESVKEMEKETKDYID